MSFLKHLFNIKNNTNQETMDNLRSLHKDYSLQDKVYEKLIPYMESKFETVKEEYRFGKWLSDWNYYADGRLKFLYEKLTVQDFIDAQNSDDEILVELREEIQFFDFIQKKEIPSEVHTWEEAAQKGYHLLAEELQQYILITLK
ncbi:hypothetical protein [Bacillus sp. SJS]|uniref:hypothetical protein n=1 Tax=Bacillus sp. SJS TaxID=1423321 RepID=UPI0004DD668C|nr:hypothetical protein [Bacillus sp. SJS]KZZ83915.1 hypothetical protein AS29_014295 [Bacillus sp. SJS]